MYITVSHSRSRELYGYVRSAESLALEVLLIVYIDSADYFMAAAEGDFFYHSPHLAIADKCYLHCLCF